MNLWAWLFGPEEEDGAARLPERPIGKGVMRPGKEPYLPPIKRGTVYHGKAPAPAPPVAPAPPPARDTGWVPPPPGIRLYLYPGAGWDWPTATIADAPHPKLEGLER